MKFCCPLLSQYMEYSLWKISHFYLISWCGNFVERHSFPAIRPTLCGNCVFPQNFHTRKSGETTIFFAVILHIFFLSFFSMRSQNSLEPTLKQVFFRKFNSVFIANAEKYGIKKEVLHSEHIRTRAKSNSNLSKRFTRKYPWQSFFLKEVVSFIKCYTQPLK